MIFTKKKDSFVSLNKVPPLRTTNVTKNHPTEKKEK